MTKLTRLLPLTLVALALAAACGGDDDDGGRAPASPTNSSAAPATRPAPAPTAQEPEGTLARFVDDVVAGDDAAVRARLKLEEVPCSHNTWPQPVCSPGEAEGALKSRLPFVGCEPVFLPKEEAADVLRQVLLNRAPALWRAAETLAGPGDGAFPVGPLALVFETAPPEGIDHPTGVLVVLNAEGQVLSFRTGCRATPRALLESLSVKRTLDVSPNTP